MLRAMTMRQPDPASPYVLRCSERVVTADDVQFIRALIQRHPELGRVALSLQLCRDWDWHRADGTWNHRACRDLLLRLHGQGKITLPPPQRTPGPHPEPVCGSWRPGQIIDPDFRLEDVTVRPIQFEERRPWQHLMAQ